MPRKIVVLDSHQFDDNRISKHIGVARSEFDVCRVNVNFHQDRTADRSADRGTILVNYTPTDNPYLNGGLFTLPLVLGGHANKIADALGQGFAGRDDPLVIHVHDPYLLGLSKKLRKHFPQSRTIYDRHEHYETWKNRLGISVPGWYENRFGDSVDELVFVSKKLDTLPEVFYGKKVTVVPNYPLASAFDERIAAEKIGSVVTSDVIEAVYFGVLNLDFDRDMRTMFRVMSEVMDGSPQVRFTLAGRVYGKEIRGMIDEFVGRFGDRATYLGEIPYGEVVRRTQQAHLGFFLLLPDSPMWSDERPVSPNKIFEYLLSGAVPVVRANLDDRDAIQDCSLSYGRSSTADEMRDDILSLISDRARMRSMMEECLRKGRKFSWETVSQGYLECYERLFAAMEEGKQ